MNLSKLLSQSISWCAIASVFFTPISTSLQNIFIIVTCLLVLQNKNFRSQIWDMCRQLWVISAICLFLLTMVGACWSAADSKDILTVVGKYSKLLYLPVLIVAFRDTKTRWWALHAFVLAMLITCIISYLKVVGWCHYHGPDPAFVFRRHIMTGYMMSFAVYLCAFFWIRSQGVGRLIYSFLILLMSYQVLFISMGRASYVIYLMLTILLFAQTVSFKKFVFALAGIGLMTVLTYSSSQIMQQRVYEAVQDWQGFHQQTNANTPVGYRLQFHKFAHHLFLRHPYLGNGTSGFSDAFKKEQPVPAWGPTLFEPHSEFWLVAADWGILGLLCLMSFFIFLSAAAWVRKETRPIALGLIASFLFGCCLDSLLLYGSSGFFFLLLMAICLAEEIPANNSYNPVGMFHAP